MRRPCGASMCWAANATISSAAPPVCGFVGSVCLARNAIERSLTHVRCCVEGVLEEVPAEEYLLPEQHTWTEGDIQALIDTADKRYEYSAMRVLRAMGIMFKQHKTRTHITAVCGGPLRR